MQERYLHAAGAAAVGRRRTGTVRRNRTSTESGSTQAAGKRESVWRKIHRPALPDGVRSEEIRATRKAPEAARLLAFSLFERGSARGKHLAHAGSVDGCSHAGKISVDKRSVQVRIAI